jgi:glycosyltransferase involved in cell wall biosynthesis
MKTRFQQLHRPIPRSTRRILLIIENVSLARDHRARKQITSLLSAGYRVGLICRRDEHNAGYRQPGLQLYEYPGPPERSGKVSFIFEYAYSLLAALVLILRARADGAVHAIQSGQPPDTYFLATLPAKVFGIRLVVDQRDLSPEVYADRFGKHGGPTALLLRVLERVSWRSADHVITVNGSLVKAIATRGGVPRERVTAVGNGPLLAAIDGRAANERLREGFTYLGCWLGVMGPQDHADLALVAISHYVHRLGRRDALFAFIGEGEATPALRQLASHLEIEEFVRFTGWLGEDACFSYLATADIGLDTNLQPEVTPVKGLEYMAHRVPFVAFDLAETRALAAEAARYVTPGDAEQMAREVAWLLDAPDERRRIGRIGRERIESEHAWDCQQGQYLRVYEQLLGQNGR